MLTSPASPAVRPPARAGRGYRPRANEWLADSAEAADPFLRILCVLLLIYATLGRTGAHIGIPLGGAGKLYIGDIALFVGLSILLLRREYEYFFVSPIAWLWLAFVAWNAARTIPFIPRYGMDALRDGVAWGYSLFAVIVASRLLADPSGFVNLLNQFSRFARVFVYFVAVVTPFSMFFPNGILGVEPPLVENMMPHVTGSAAAVMCRLISVPAVWWMVMSIDAIAIGSQGRGVLMAFLAAIGVVWLSNRWSRRPPSRRIGVLAGSGLIVAAILMMNINFGVTPTGRAIGPNQIFENVVGSFSHTGNIKLDGSRRWRIGIWDKIVDYTVFGPYFWTGKGYGINLLDDAGFQLDPLDPSRTPENSHLTFLARGGVPGLVLWAALQLSWAAGILRALFFARWTGRRRMAGVMAFLLAYWTEFMVHASTGVVIESPHGGIWFWTIFGIGVAATRLVRHDPDFFERLGPAEPSRRTPAHLV